MIYQKDGPGPLLRCYLNRIFSPPWLAALADDNAVREPGDLNVLNCSHCLAAIGIPSRYKDGRLAYHLIEGRVIVSYLGR